MLLNARLSNFRSFEGSTHLSMVSSSKIQNLKKQHVEVLPDSKILKYSVIFGPNASGKSNLIQAFQFIQWFLMNGLNHSLISALKGCFCRTRPENADEASSFELQIYLNGRAVSYGFSVNFHKLQILEEYLSLDRPDGSRNILFHRDGNHLHVNSSYFTGDDLNRLQIYRDDYGLKKNVSFLGFLNDSKIYGSDSTLSVFSEIYDYLTRSITVVLPQSKLQMPFSTFSEKILVETMREYISSFDTGVTDIRTTTVSRTELESRIGEDFLEHIEGILSDRNGMKEVTVRSDNRLYCVKKDEITKDLICETVQFQHNKDCWFDFSEESEGTVRLFDLAPLFLNDTANHIYLVDELDRSLHTKTVEKLLRMFEDFNVDKKNQLIFSTHDIDLMDQKKFRKDEIWFIERDERNVSHLYSLDRFKERADKDLRKGYLEGRYGALPVFNDESIEYSEEETE